MFTRSFEKTRLALFALLAVGGLYFAILAGSLGLSGWAERELESYPFKSEDWLRYLLAAKFEGAEQPRIFLTGPSTVRENLLYDRFEAAFPGYQVFQGGISLGTIEDATLGLEYLDAVHGEAARMDLIVVGIAPRFLANIPDERPFKDGLENYSPHYGTRREEAGIVLVAKGPLEGLAARLHFLAAKQPQRFGITLLAIANHWIRQSGPEGQALIDRLVRNPVAGKLASLAGFWQVKNHDFSRLLAFAISPYKYSLSGTIDYPEDWIENYDPAKDGWWGTTYLWDPRKDAAAVRARLERLRDFAEERGIALLFVNLPERDFSRDRFDEDNYRAYLEIVKSAIGEAPLVNLRDFLVTEEYHDREHTLPPGSRRLTDEIIGHARPLLQGAQASN